MGNLNCSKPDYSNNDSIEFSVQSRAAAILQKQFRRIHSASQIQRLLIESIFSKYRLQNITVETINLKTFNEQINHKIASTLISLKGFDVTIDAINNSKQVYELPCLKFTYNSNGKVEYYHGQWSLSCHMEGIGILIGSDDTLYYGNFYCNMKKGRGILVQSNGDYYQGFFESNMTNGKGILNIAKDYNYNGGWKMNCKHGMGIEIYQDGSKYEGGFVMNIRQGKGKYYYTDGSFYEGNFENSQFNGKGRLVWKDGRKYIGDFINGKMKGEGYFTWPNGSRYEGGYNNQMKEGRGVFKWKDGRILTGFWFLNKPHGLFNISYAENKTNITNKDDHKDNDDNEHNHSSSYSMTFRYGKIIHSNSPINYTKELTKKHFHDLEESSSVRLQNI